MQAVKMNYRHPLFEEGLAIYQLIKSCPPLDTNSIYYYYILCRDFSETCVVAEQNHQIMGFLSAYRKPQESDCLFVWQVAVSNEARGQHSATNMLDWLIARTTCENIRTVETTISPTNDASQNLFKRFANKHQAKYQTTPFLNISQFGNKTHEEEILFRIHPLKL